MQFRAPPPSRPLARPVQGAARVRLSAFNHYVEGYPEPGSTLVHNSFTGGMAELDAPTLASLRRLGDGAAPDVAVDPGLLDEEVGIVVASAEDEERAFRAWYADHLASASQMTAIVSTTFACNLACTYCCQDRVLDGRTMDADTVAATAAWLASRALEVGAARVSLQVTGGEPLLRPDLVEALARGLRGRLAGTGVEVALGLITNGVLLEPDLVERWLPLGLVSAQVTLDGDETTHARTRPSRRGEDTFGAVFVNALCAARRLRLTVVGNYLPETAAAFPRLLARLRDAGLPAGTAVRLRPALAGLSAPSDAAAACTWSGSSPETLLALADATEDAGFDPGNLLTLGPCGLGQRHHYAVDPQGWIYKCAGFLGHEPWAVGHVTSGLTGRYEELLAADSLAGCAACAHRPACGGGCRATAWLKAGRPEGNGCEIEYFERMTGPLAARRYAAAAGLPRPRQPVPPLAAPGRLAAQREQER